MKIVNPHNVLFISRNSLVSGSVSEIKGLNLKSHE